MDEWSLEYRELVKMICEALHYDALVPRSDVSGKGGSKTYFAAPQARHGSARNVIVKFGPEAEVKAEHKKAKDAVNYWPRCNYIKGTYYDDQEHGCIVMEFAGEATSRIDEPPPDTFVEFFRRADIAEIEEILPKLFDDLLNKNGLQCHTQNKSVFACHRLSDEEEFRHSLMTFRPRAALLLEWWNQAAELDKNSKSVTMFCHGDLHGENILISKDGSGAPQPWIIDFGRTDTAHVFYDHAKLERDIVLRMSVKTDSNPAKEIESIAPYPDLPSNSDDSAKDADLLKTIRSIAAVRENSQTITPKDIACWEKEYFVALYAQYMFTASDTRQASQIRDAALTVCELLQPRIEKKLSKKVRVDRATTLRGQVLWMLAYSFFRLDQLPCGGWSKTLAMCMEAIWDGDGGAIQRNPQMRTIGGTDQTNISLFHFADRLERVVTDSNLRHLLFQQNRVVPRAIDTMDHAMTAMGLVGGINVALGKQIRHTAVAAASLLKVKKAFPMVRNADDMIDRYLKYLSSNIDSWMDDTSNLFATWAALLKIRELLECESIIEDLERGIAARLSDKIPAILGAMVKRLARHPPNKPKPVGTLHRSLEKHFPTPYGDFWRMQRSGFLMYFPLLIREDGSLNDGIPDDLRQRFSFAFDDLLRNIPVDDPDSSSFVSYHRDPNTHDPPKAGFVPDYGLSASLAATLKLPSVRIWLGTHQEHALNDKLAVLHSTLLANFDQYPQKREIFHFCTGTSFARCFDVADVVSVDALVDLDAELSKILDEGVTEAALDGLVKWISERADAVNEFDGESVRELLLDSLESGVHTPDQAPENWSAESPYEQLCSDQEWDQRRTNAVQSAREVYDERVGDLYIEHYGPQPVHDLVRNLSARDVFEDQDTNGLRALDVGCGPGQYAELLKKQGFEVDLLDVSSKMLNEAARRLNIDTPPPRDIYHLNNSPAQEELYDLVFACALMVHVPKERVAEIYQTFDRLLRPNGVLFVNYKIGDHTLISLDGRFYEHYSDEKAIEQDLEAAGFRIAWRIGATNRTNLYGRRRTIRWVNFYCRKAN